MYFCSVNSAKLFQGCRMLVVSVCRSHLYLAHRRCMNEAKHVHIHAESCSFPRPLGSSTVSYKYPLIGRVTTCRFIGTNQSPSSGSQTCWFLCQRETVPPVLKECISHVLYSVSLLVLAPSIPTFIINRPLRSLCFN